MPTSYEVDTFLGKVDTFFQKITPKKAKNSRMMLLF